eukprot:COSAG01_NODE_17438_length_1151_cov_6.937262_1_plen_98_part_01
MRRRPVTLDQEIIILSVISHLAPASIHSSKHPFLHRQIVLVLVDVVIAPCITLVWHHSVVSTYSFQEGYRWGPFPAGGSRYPFVVPPERHICGLLIRD